MKKGLGRGLNALIDGVKEAGQARQPEATEQVKLEASSDTATNGARMVDIRKVEPNALQPRKYFDDDSLEELAESMKTFGVIQPLLVRDNNGYYTIIAGERRYRAARIAKLSEIPIIVKDYTEMEIMQVALIENIQRQDLTSIEEANCYKRLMEDFFFSADDIASKLGKNKHAIISALHLLELTPRAQELAAEGKITASHAKALLSVEDPGLQASCAETIVADGLSVRAAEGMIAQVLKLAAKQATVEANNLVEDEQDVNMQENVTYAYRRAEYELRHALGSQVYIRPGKKVSKIEIEYYDTDDLDRIMNLLKSVK